MSEPSTEAKQAAHRWNVEETENGVRICKGDHQRSDDCEWEYYSSDTATAKLREELGYMTQSRDQWKGAFMEVEKEQEATHAKQLAHQQSDAQSAPTAEDISAMQKAGYRFEPTGDGGACYPTKHGSWDKPKARLVLDWRSYLQPSAPTADVEKIAREATSKLLRWYAGPLPPWDEKELRSIVTDALAQVHAPLVAAATGLLSELVNGQNVPSLSAIEKLRAALTGTGECLK